MKVVKKPIEFDAVEFDGSPKFKKTFEELEIFKIYINDGSDYYFYILQSTDGYIDIEIGDIIIKDINGDFYPVKPDVFSRTYDVVE